MNKSLLLGLLFVASLVSTLVAQPYYLRGDQAPCGWSGNFTPQCQLTDPDGDGTFTLAFDFGTAPIGRKEFKIYNQGNDSWFPGSNSWYDHKGGIVTFNFKPGPNTVSAADGNTVVCAPGTWSSAGFNPSTPMQLVSANTYCVTVPTAGNYIWKPTRCGSFDSWEQFDGTRSINSGNWSMVTTAPNQQVCVTYDPATGKVIGAPPPAGYFLRGTAGQCDFFGNSTPLCQLTDPDGDGCLELTYNLGTTPLGLQEFKIYRPDNNRFYPDGANMWYLHKGGPVTFKFCLASNEITVLDGFTGSLCAPSQLNGFNNAAPMEKFDNGTYCISVPTPGTYEWKPTYCGTFSSWQPVGGQRSNNSDNWSFTTTMPNQRVCVTYDPLTGRVRPGSFFVPTMTQWGLFLFGMMVMIFGLVTVRQRKLALAGETNTGFSLKSMPFDRASFMRSCGGVLAVAILLFSAAVSLFGYEMTHADVPGALLAVPMIAYLVELLKGEEA
jgi:hypothetical protein